MRETDKALTEDDAAHDLVARFFLSRDRRASEFRSIEIEALDPFLRGLLFTDGTVIRTLEVHTLSQVALEVIEQLRVRTPKPESFDLAVPEGSESIRRRVAIRISPLAVPAVCAESFIVAERVPETFTAALAADAGGIGGSLDAVYLATSRELLWFGLGTAAEWAPLPRGHEALVRLYRISTDGQPAILIREEFSVVLSSGVYRLVGLPDRA